MLVENQYLSKKYLDEINEDELLLDFYESLKDNITNKIDKTNNHYDEICEVCLAASYILYRFHNFNTNLQNKINKINHIFEINDNKIDFNGRTELSANRGTIVRVNFAHDFINDKDIEGSQYFLLKTMMHEFCHIGSSDNLSETGFNDINTTLNEILTVCIEDKLTKEFCDIGINCTKIHSKPQVYGSFDFGRDSLDGYRCQSIYGKFIMAIEDEETLIKNYFRLGNQDESTKYGQYLLQEYAPLIHTLDTKPFNLNNKKLMNEYISNANKALFSILKKKIDRGMSLDEYLNMTSRLSNLHIENIDTGENVLQESLKMLDTYYFYKEESNNLNIQKLFYGYESDTLDNFESIICSLRMNYDSKTIEEKENIQNIIEKNIPSIEDLLPIEINKGLSIEDLNNEKISFKKRKEDLISIDRENNSSIYRTLNTITEEQMNSMSREEFITRLKIMSKYLAFKFNLKKDLDNDTKLLFQNTLFLFDKKEQFENLLVDFNNLSPKYLKSLLSYSKGSFTEGLFRNQRYEELQILIDIVDVKNLSPIRTSIEGFYLDDFLRKSWELPPSEKSLISLLDLTFTTSNIYKDNLVSICIDNLKFIENIQDINLKELYIEKFKNDLAYLTNIKGLENLLDVSLTDGTNIRNYLCRENSDFDGQNILNDILIKSNNIKNDNIMDGLKNKNIFILSRFADNGEFNNIKDDNMLKEIFTIFLTDKVSSSTSLESIMPTDDLKDVYSRVMIDIVTKTKEYDNFFNKANSNLLKDEHFLKVIKDYLNNEMETDYYLRRFIEKRNYSENLAINTLSILLEENQKFIGSHFFSNLSRELRDNILERIDNLDDTKENSKLKEFKEEFDKSSRGLSI